VQKAQAGFLKKRNACAAGPADDLFTCLFNTSLARLAEFGRDFAAAARPAAPLTLEALPAILVSAVKTDPLAARLLRAYGRSPDSATLETRSAAVALKAGSVGGNGHVCDFESVLTWEAAKGVWSGGTDSPMSWLILPDGIAIASSRDESREFCGARASWPEVYFVPPAR